MKVIAVYNIKGGVGKTATSVNIAYVAASEGNSVLLIDLDPQGASSFYFKMDGKNRKKLKKSIFGNDSVENSIQETEFDNLSILPADSRYRKLDNFLSDMKNSEKWLRKLLKPVRQQFDYIIIDCPPNITSLSENIFKNVDAVLIPVVPTVLSIRTYEQLNEYFKEEGFDRTKLLPFYSMVERKKNMHSDSMIDFSKAHKECLNIAIYCNSLVEKMGEYLSPVVYKYPNSESAESYISLWKKLKRKL